MAKSLQIVVSFTICWFLWSEVSFLADAMLDREQTVSWVGMRLLESHNGSKSTAISDFMKDWQNQLPEIWREDAALDVLKVNSFNHWIPIPTKTSNIRGSMCCQIRAQSCMMTAVQLHLMQPHRLQSRANTKRARTIGMRSSRILGVRALDNEDCPSILFIYY